MASTIVIELGRFILLLSRLPEAVHWNRCIPFGKRKITLTVTISNKSVKGPTFKRNTAKSCLFEISHIASDSDSPFLKTQGE